MKERVSIRELIHKGKIDEAIYSIKSSKPEIFDTNPEFLFDLQLQKLIEMIKENLVDESLDYAKKELLPKVENNPTFLDKLEKAMSLLAYEDFSKSPISELAQPSQRIKISSEVNGELLKTYTQDKVSKIPLVLKVMLWIQEKLKHKVIFPIINDIKTGELENPSQSR